MSNPTFKHFIELSPNTARPEEGFREFAVDTDQGWYWVWLNSVSTVPRPSFLELVQFAIAVHHIDHDLHGMAQSCLTIVASHMAETVGTKVEIAGKGFQDLVGSLVGYHDAIERVQRLTGIRPITSHDIDWLGPLFEDPEQARKILRQQETRAAAKEYGFGGTTNFA